MYKLMGNGGLLTRMHLIGYTFPFFSITRKYNVPNKFHNDGVTKVVTPHSYKLNFRIPYLKFEFFIHKTLRCPIN